MSLMECVNPPKRTWPEDALKQELVKLASDRWVWWATMFARNNSIPLSDALLLALNHAKAGWTYQQLNESYPVD